ncbi:MAG: 50S ribosomal protein L30 [Odoribacteraceae bacterium]|jgi:large subunit ribosomal protein L30|nr:50S ribosomal protein L30 [Odoribacteraceae bacterium]
MAKIKVTLVRSTIRHSKRQVETVRSLGLRRISSSAVHEATPPILGMVAKVSHLVRVEEVK